MASLSTISPRLAQGAFEPVLRQRPRSPSLSRISRPRTPTSSSRTHRRCVSASTSAGALPASPTPLSTPHACFESLVHDRGRALRRRTPHMFDNDSYGAMSSTTLGANNQMEVIIPLPAPFTPPTRPVALRPAVQVAALRETSHSNFGSALFGMGPTLEKGSRSAPVSLCPRPRRNSFPTSTTQPVQTPRFPPGPGLLAEPFAPKQRPTSNESSSLQLHNDLVDLVHIDTPVLALDDPKLARAVPQHLRPQMTVESTSMAHTLYLPLVRYAPDEITITVVPGEEGKRDELRVAVDRWGADVEDEQGYLEYRVRFDVTARLGGVQAGFRDDRLRISVPRDV